MSRNNRIEAFEAEVRQWQSRAFRAEAGIREGWSAFTG